MPRTDGVEELQAALQRVGRLLASRQAAARVTSAAGVDVSQQGAALLRTLWRQGRSTVAALSAEAAMDVGAVSRQVKLLEAAGAVRRSRDPDDGRVVLVELTPAGRRMAASLRIAGRARLARALAGWTDGERQALATQLDRLVDDLTAAPIPDDRVGLTGRGRRR